MDNRWNHAVPMVDPETGLASTQFLRWLQDNGNTLTEVDEDLETIDTIAADVDTLQSRLIDTPAGGGLEGGGDLSADRSLELQTQGLVVPDTYGDGTNIPRITVNDKGIITDIEEIAASGGGSGGGGDWWFDPPVASDFPVFFTSSGSAVLATDDADYGLVIQANNASDATLRTRGIAKALPGGGVAWSVETHFWLNMYSANSNGGGLYLFEQATGKILSLSLLHDSNVTQIDTWNGTLSAFTARGSRFARNEIGVFAKASFDGVNTIKIWFSSDGKHWLEARSVLQTVPFTTAPSHVGVAISQLTAQVSANEQRLYCDRWVQSW